MPIGSLTSQAFSNLYLNELDRFVKHQLKARYYLRYADDFVLLHEDPHKLAAWRRQIEEFLHDKLALKLHPRKTSVQAISRGCDYLGYIVRPHSLQVGPRTFQALRRCLYFFNHLLDPAAFPHRSVPPQTKLNRYLRQGLIQPPLKLTPEVLLSILHVINSYYGLMGHADTYQLRRRIYLQEFHRLQHYFLPGKGFAKVVLRPLRILKREGLIAL